MTNTNDYPAHWRLGCSIAKRWVNCPGSQHADDSNGDAGPGKMALIGTFGHKLVEQILQRKPITLTAEERELYNSLDPDDQNWLKTSVKRCCGVVREMCETLAAECGDSGGNWSVEYEVKIKSDKIDDHGGTMDVLGASPVSIHVIDFKFGAVAVEADGNEQLQCYLNLARQKHPGRERFRATIVQPSFRGDDTVEFSQDELDAFAMQALSASKADYRSGDPSWCTYCPLLATCDEAAKMGVRAVDEFGTIEELINEVRKTPTPEQVERLERIVLMHKLTTIAYDKSSGVLKQWYNEGAELSYHRVTSSNYRSWHAHLDVLDYLRDKVTAEQLAEAVSTTVVSPPALQALLEMTKKTFDKMFHDGLQLTNRPTLKAGVKPSAKELALDLPIYEGEG